jgi:ATP-binding cassette, subfamily C, bacterial CydC
MLKTFWRLLALYRPAWGLLVLSGLVALAAVLANIALMAVSGWFIASMAIAGAAAAAFNYFTPAAIIRGCAILRTGGRYLERLVSHDATLRPLAATRVWLFRRIEPQSPDRVAAWHSGDLASRFKGDIDRLEAMPLRILLPLAVAVAASAVLLSVLGHYGSRFALIELAGLLVAVLAPVAVTRLAWIWGRGQVHLSAALTEAVVEGVQGLADLRVFAPAARRHAARLAEIGAALVASQQKTGRAGALALAAGVLAANLAAWSVVAVAVPLVRAGTLAPADLVLLALLALAGVEAVAPVPGAVHALGGVLEAAKRLFALIDAPAPAPVDEDAEAPPPVDADLVLKDVRFRHAPAAPLVFDGFSLTVGQGERVALTGPVGAGKSTLVALLTGLLSPQAGSIAVGGRAVASLGPEARRRPFAVAPQAPGLFTGTLADNLRVAWPEAPEAALRHVLAVAQLEEMVADLPQGLETWVGEAGLTLSGGQARRLAVARALLKPAPVLILDEPGEGLDYATERALLAAAVADLGGRTLILITHRSAGLDLMDRVVRLEPPAGDQSNSS